MSKFLIIVFISVSFYACKSNKSETSSFQGNTFKYDEKKAEKVFKEWAYDTINILNKSKASLGKRQFYFDIDSTSFTIDNEYKIDIDLDSIKELLMKDIKVYRLIGVLDFYKELPKTNFKLRFIYREIFFPVEPSLYPEKKYSFFNEMNDVIVEDDKNIINYDVFRLGITDKKVTPKVRKINK